MFCHRSPRTEGKKKRKKWKSATLCDFYIASLDKARISRSRDIGELFFIGVKCRAIQGGKKSERLFEKSHTRTQKINLIALQIPSSTQKYINSFLSAYRSTGRISVNDTYIRVDVKSSWIFTHVPHFSFTSFYEQRSIYRVSTLKRRIVRNRGGSKKKK